MSEYIVMIDNDEILTAIGGRGVFSIGGFRTTGNIVRCKDCKYLIAHGAGCSYWDNCDIQSVNGFCAWGERRANE